MSCGPGASDCASRDLVRSRMALLLWCLPAAVILATAFSDVARPWLWIPSLLVMGLSCLKNASRCGRMHCRYTGPLFLLGALATALDLSGLLAIDWRWILGGLALGTALAFCWEWARGLYVGS